jgi:hypothetical protein
MAGDVHWRIDSKSGTGFVTVAEIPCGPEYAVIEVCQCNPLLSLALGSPARGASTFKDLAEKSQRASRAHAGAHKRGIRPPAARNIGVRAGLPRENPALRPELRPAAGGHAPSGHGPAHESATRQRATRAICGAHDQPQAAKPIGTVIRAKRSPVSAIACPSGRRQRHRPTSPATDDVAI